MKLQQVLSYTRRAIDDYQMIEEVTGQRAKLFRPPYGEYNNTLISTTKYYENYDKLVEYGMLEQ